MALFVGYVRVSGETQKGNTSLPTQRQAVERYCNENGHTLLRIYQDVESAESAESRAGFQRALQMVAQGRAQGLITMKQDRFCRSVLDSEVLKREFTRLQAQLVFVEDPINFATDDGELLFQFKAVFHEYERKMIARRCEGGRLRKAEMGLYSGGYPPYGWRAFNKTLLPDPAEQAAIRRVFEMRAQGARICDIKRALESEGYKPRRAKTWSDVMVWKIINDKRVLVSKLGLAQLAQ